jgi:hypothetical protein
MKITYISCHFYTLKAHWFCTNILFYNFHTYVIEIPWYYKFVMRLGWTNTHVVGFYHGTNVGVGTHKAVKGQHVMFMVQWHMTCMN